MSKLPPSTPDAERSPSPSHDDSQSPTTIADTSYSFPHRGDQPGHIFAPAYSPKGSPTGPLSPAHSASSFVFPIRSVYQGIVTSGSQRSDESDPLRKSSGNSTQSYQSGKSALSSGLERDRLEGPDAGIQSITQLLQQGQQGQQSQQGQQGQESQQIQQDGSDTHQLLPRQQQAGAATYHSKHDRERNSSSGGGDSMPAPSQYGDSAAVGDLSTPYSTEEDGRRLSLAFVEALAGLELGGDGNGNGKEEDAKKEETEKPASDGGERPKLGHSGSGETVKQVSDGGDAIHDPVSTPDASAGPSSASHNYRHFPNEDAPSQATPVAGAHTSPRRFSSIKQKRGSPVRTTPRAPTQQPGVELQHPIPQRPSSPSSKANKAAEKSRKARGTSSHGSKVSIDVDESGVRSLISDLSGIVRLGDVGSHNGSKMGTGTKGTSGTDGSVEHSGFNSANADHVHGRAESHGSGPRTKRAKFTARQNSVRDFVQDQAQTTNLQDPNAPTPSPTPHVIEEASEEEEEGDGKTPSQLGEELSLPATPSELHQPAGSERTAGESQPAAAGVSGDPDAPVEPAVTMRFEHVATEDGHHIVAGREGNLKKCEDEPITTPGAVQGFGVLLVLEEDEETGDMPIRQVSENSTEILGLSPKYLFQLDCFTRLLTADQEDILRDTLDYLPALNRSSNETAIEDDGPSVFLLTGFGEPGSEEDGDEGGSIGSSAGGKRREWTCWVAAHRPGHKNWTKKDADGKDVPPPNLIILEFELERDVYNPLFDSGEASTAPTSTASPARPSTPDSGNTASNNSGSARTGGDRSLDSLAGNGAGPRAGGSKGSSSTVSEFTSVARPQSSSQTSFTSMPPHSDDPMGLEGLDMDMSPERIMESTTNHAKPLRALERMRGKVSEVIEGRNKRKGRPPRPRTGTSTGTMDIFAVLGQINDQLGSAPDLETFLKVTVGLVQDVCRFHRVLIYQFDEQMNGLVVSELVEWGSTTDLYRGLRFPAADIPPQARELYKINKVRMLYDRSLTTARMVLRHKEDLDYPLDMTHCYLRAMSPIHIKYLANMGVRSSMSVSIMAFGQLWGLIACHSYGQHGMRVSFPVRQMLRLLSESISKNIERLSYAARLHTRKLISTVPSPTHPTGYIVSNADDLLQIFDADAGLLVIGDGCKLLGQNGQGHAMLAIAEYLRIMKFGNIKSTSSIVRDYPDLLLPRAPDTIAGLLYVPLTAKAGQDFIVFLRKGQVRDVQWAGKPFKDEESGKAASLEPRKSFKIWTERVTGSSRVWTDDQLESAGVLALIYGKFIQVWREKQSAMVSNQLTAILLSNTSHAVRTPLSQIINTLELALAGDIDADVRKMLENSHQASRALLFHVHDLLDLTRIETGNETAFNDPFDLRQSISEAVRLYETELIRRGIDFRVKFGDGLPQFVIGDARKIRTVISNLVANSVKVTPEGFIEVYCGLRSHDNGSSTGLLSFDNSVHIEIVISDSGCGIPNEKLEEIFVTLEGAEEGIRESSGVGLGLAVVARIVEQLEGQLRAESEVGVGTRFFFNLPMAIHDPSKPKSRSSRAGSSQRASRADSSSSKSLVSLRSDGSGVPEIDSFVQDLQGSHMEHAPEDDERLEAARKRMSEPGVFPVTDSSWPIRPSKMSTEAQSVSPTFMSPDSSVPKRRSPREIQARDRRAAKRLTFGDPKTDTPVPQSSVDGASSLPPHRSKVGSTGKTLMRIMVVEDDAINSTILQKRLRMDKHSVIAVTNGQECVDFLKRDRDIDAILMDIQMPIMDGRTAASEIRKLESKGKAQIEVGSFTVDGRIPIFAVSASLYESDRSNLAKNFDGWMLKPLDFARVRDILQGLESSKKRKENVYQQGYWEKGGYFRKPASQPASHARLPSASTPSNSSPSVSTPSASTPSSSSPAQTT
ncbi:hypothetical protein B9479_004278 [Cryptococcus floricola]|uniref:Bacteriophytochrome histidine kinase n=1 Tax=Cryptococcus floricola TaxID=2591691 RepID=A0A5D3AX22_9TREE|nr:hypothetical protein B9479_004278 [Cryptococcus floricola]